MSCCLGLRGEGSVFVWAGQRAPGRWDGVWSRLKATLLRGVAARLAHEWPWCLCTLLGGEARAPRMGAMSHAVAEARRAALSLPQSEWPCWGWLVRRALFCALAWSRGLRGGMSGAVVPAC